MSSQGSTDLEYTWHGVLVTDCDALLLLERCLRGELAHIPRRPHDSERTRLIKSGSIFVYESNASGIKRWTDGINWSPSRILTNFLVYHELEKAPPPGEKKRAIKRKRSESDLGEDSQTAEQTTVEEDWTDDDRRLMGSPQDNYGWKTGGLVKKTYSFDFRGAAHHIISYFKPEDVRSGKLKRPIHCEEYARVFIRPELIEQGSRSRNPIIESHLEQQRWERPLYRVNSNVSLMRQYPQHVHSPYNAAPRQPIDYMATMHHSSVPHPHHLPHRSSIHFPLERNLGHSTSLSAYHVQHPSRHNSVTAASGNQFPTNPSQDALAHPAISNDTPRATYQQEHNILNATRAPSLPTQHHAIPKPELTYKVGELLENAYVTLPQAHPGYVLSNSTQSMPALDTAFSHTVVRPEYPQAPHTTSHVHSSPVSHYTSSSIPQAPLNKKGKLDTTYSSLVGSSWTQAASAPVTPAHMAVSSDASSPEAQASLASLPFPNTSNYHSEQSFPFHQAASTAIYNNVNSEFGASQPQGLFMSGFTSQLTAPS